jgi:hypothetical protein
MELLGVSLVLGILLMVSQLVPASLSLDASHTQVCASGQKQISTLSTLSLRKDT